MAATTEIRPISCEVGLLPRDARLRPLHARPDAGADHRHARLAGRGTDHSTGWEPTRNQALHAPLQLPAVQHRRGAARRARPVAARSATARWPSARCAPIIPGRDEFPYTIRIVSEILSSNGSTSMGSVCGIDAGADGCRRADSAPRSRAWRWA